MYYILDINLSNNLNLLKKIGDRCRDNNGKLIITDMFIYETCRTVDGVNNFKYKMKYLADIDRYLVVTRAIGELIASEVKNPDSPSNIFDQTLTEWIGPTALKIRSEISTSELGSIYCKIREQLPEHEKKLKDGEYHKKNMQAMVNEIKEKFSVEIKKIVKNLPNSTYFLMTDPLYETIEREIIDVFNKKERESKISYPFPYNSVLKIFIQYLLIHTFEWHRLEGIDNYSSKKMKNDMLDLDYAITASKLMGILVSKESKLLSYYLCHMKITHNSDDLTWLFDEYNALGLESPKNILK